jgi:pyruvate formate lyase activating enzyme
MKFGGFEKFTLIDYPGKISCVAYTIGCNFRCPYCHNPELVDETVENKIDEDYVMEFLCKRKSMLDGIVITGGEPTIHEDLLKFMKKVKKSGLLVKLDSNGTNPDVLRKAIKERLVDYIAMDIKAPLFKYSKVVARPLDVDKIKESINVIKDSGVSYEFRTTVVKSLLSPEDIEQIGKEIEGAEKFYLQKFIPTKVLNPQFIKKVTYSDEEYKIFQFKLQQHVKYCGIR